MSSAGYFMCLTLLYEIGSVVVSETGTSNHVLEYMSTITQLGMSTICTVKNPIATIFFFFFFVNDYFEVKFVRYVFLKSEILYHAKNCCSVNLKTTNTEHSTFGITVLLLVSVGLVFL